MSEEKLYGQQLKGFLDEFLSGISQVRLNEIMPFVPAHIKALYEQDMPVGEEPGWGGARVSSLVAAVKQALDDMGFVRDLKPEMPGKLVTVWKRKTK